MNTPGFRKKMRRLIHEAPVSYREKSELFFFLSRLGPDAAWHEYKRQLEDIKQEQARTSIQTH